MPPVLLHRGHCSRTFAAVCQSIWLLGSGGGCEKTVVLHFEWFPYVCPEPVLVKGLFLGSNTVKNKKDRFLTCIGVFLELLTIAPVTSCAGQTKRRCFGEFCR